MFRISNIMFVLSAILLSASVSFAGNAAMDCVDTHWKGNKFIFENRCDINVFVSYCSEDKKMSGKLCGQYSGSAASKKGTFFTHSFNLKAGKTNSLYKPGSVRYAVCKGMTGFGKDIKDDRRGSFWCPEPRRLRD